LLEDHCRAEFLNPLSGQRRVRYVLDFSVSFFSFLLRLNDRLCLGLTETDAALCLNKEEKQGHLSPELLEPHARWRCRTYKTFPTRTRGRWATP